MIRSALPAAQPGGLPQFIDKAGCEAWLAGQPLSNTAQMQTTLTGILADLNVRTIPARERYRILETLRATVTEVETASCKRFEYRPLPMTAAEHSTFLISCRLWQEMATGYRHCLRACLDKDPEVAELAAKIGHRAISAMRLEQLSRYRGRATIPARWWLNLHALLLSAEQLGIEQAPVADRLLKETRESTLAGHYAMAVLLHLCRPEALSRKQLAALLRWLGRWRELASFQAVPAPPVDDAGLLLIDLASGTPLRLPVEARMAGQEKLRRLQVDSILGKLKGRISALQEGQTPEDLKLGSELPAAECISLLQHLSACLRHPLLLPVENGQSGLRQQDASPAGEVEIVASVEDIYQLSGGVSLGAAAAPSATSNQREREQIAVFGRVLKPETGSQAARVRSERWQLDGADESGVCLRYPAGRPATAFRIAHGDLLGMLEGKDLRLAVIRSLLQLEDGSLYVKLQPLPGGRPRGLVAIAGTGGRPESGRRRLPAVFLPAGTAGEGSASIFVPAGNSVPAGPGPRLEIPDLPKGLRLGEVSEQGSNFERWYCVQEG